MPEGVVADSAGNWVDPLGACGRAPLFAAVAGRSAYRDVAALSAVSCGDWRWRSCRSEQSAFDLWIVIGAGIGAFLMRGAGCTWNDITDREIDAQVARTRSRPIPSGKVSVRGAVIWMCAQAGVSLLILLTFPALAIALGFLAIVPVLVYPFAKRFTWWPQVFLGVAFNWGALLIWAAHSGTMQLDACCDLRRRDQLDPILRYDLCTPRCRR